MAKSLRQLPRLARPLQTTRSDVLVMGHGPYVFSGTTIVPPRIELWVLGPFRASISAALVQALETEGQISKLGMTSPATREWNPVAPVIYTAGTRVPDFILYPPDGRMSEPRPDGPRMLRIQGVNSQRLSSTWGRLQTFSQAWKTLRVFWVACSAIPSEVLPLVCHE